MSLSLERMSYSDQWKTTLGGLDLSGPCEIQFQKYQLIPDLISQFERFTSFTLTLNNSRSGGLEVKSSDYRSIMVQC